MDEKTIKATEEISRAVALQNSVILRSMLFPQVCQYQSGYFEDPHGQPIYVDGYGNTRRVHGLNDLNGWTV